LDFAIATSSRWEDAMLQPRDAFVKDEGMVQREIDAQFC
jgi:hypothetical protein